MDELSESAVDLDDEEQRHIRELAAALSQRDHWSLLGLERDTSPQAVKRAYFAASKRYHPDRYFGRNIGEYRRLLEKIFGAIKQAYDVLSDPEARRAYEARVPPPAVPSHDPSSPAIEIELEIAQPPTEDRAAVLEQRRREILEERRLRRSGAVSSSPMGENARKGRDMYDLGMRHLGLGQLAAAARSFRLAVTYDPANVEYKAKLAMADEGCRVEQAARSFERAQQANEVGNTARAAQLFAEASDSAPQKTGYAVSAAEALLAAGKLLPAWTYAERALALASERAEVRRVVAEVLEARGMLKEAREHLAEALRLDPRDTRAKNAAARMNRVTRR